MTIYRHCQLSHFGFLASSWKIAAKKQQNQQQTDNCEIYLKSAKPPWLDPAQLTVSFSFCTCRSSWVRVPLWPGNEELRTSGRHVCHHQEGPVWTLTLKYGYLSLFITQNIFVCLRSNSDRWLDYDGKPLRLKRALILKTQGQQGEIMKLSFLIILGAQGMKHNVSDLPCIGLVKLSYKYRFYWNSSACLCMGWNEAKRLCSPTPLPHGGYSYI